jgi:hypothetical protein
MVEVPLAMFPPLKTLLAVSKCHKRHNPNSHAGFWHFLSVTKSWICDTSKSACCPTVSALGTLVTLRKPLLRRKSEHDRDEQRPLPPLR